MASNYPGTLDTFTNPVGTNTLDTPDHAGQHTGINDSMLKVQATLGTTAGTALFNSFGASDKPAKKDNESFGSATLTGGTANNLVLGTPSITGGTMNTGVFGTPSVTGGTMNSATLGTPNITGGTAGGIVVSYYVLGSLAYTGTASGTTTLQLGSASRHLLTMPNSAGSLTLAVTGAVDNRPFILEILQGTAGNGTVGWFSTIKWAGSAAPTQTLTASRKDTFGFISTSGTTFDGYIVGQNV